MCEGSHADGWAPAAWKASVSWKINPMWGAQTPRHASHADHEDPMDIATVIGRFREARLGRRRMSEDSPARVGPERFLRARVRLAGSRSLTRVVTDRPSAGAGPVC
jgi:hypothetical protein